MKDGNDVWYRKYTKNDTVYIVTVREAHGSVRFRTWRSCEKPNELDQVTWMAGDEFGVRSDCNNRESFLLEPHRWNMYSMSSRVRSRTHSSATT
jgi:hypothetical protein